LRTFLDLVRLTPGAKPTIFTEPPSSAVADFTFYGFASEFRPSAIALLADHLLTGRETGPIACSALRATRSEKKHGYDSDNYYGS
jgi:hypothetical protein